MMQGTVTDAGEPIITIALAGRDWRALIDTGFNDDLELPDQLQPHVNARFAGPTQFILAGGQTSVEDVYLVDFPFDGDTIEADATFVPGDEILIGTGLLAQHRLEIHFPAQTVLIERVP